MARPSTRRNPNPDKPPNNPPGLPPVDLPPHPPNNPPVENPDLVGIQAVINQLQQQNAALQEQIQSVQHKVDDVPDPDLDDPQPLTPEIMGAPVPDNFKPPHLETYDGKADPKEHLVAFKNRTMIIGASESLKCKLFPGTLKSAALRWFMNLPRHSIIGFEDFSKKFVAQFQVSTHRKVTATSLFNLRQRSDETLREYLGRFNDATIHVLNPNHEMFVGAFHNGLKARFFNESLAQKPAFNMEEIRSRVECYIKGEESNAAKRSRDAKERGFDQRRSRNDSPAPKRRPGPVEWDCRRVDRPPIPTNLTPLNTRRVTIYNEVLHLRLIPPAPPFKGRMGPQMDHWCKYHKTRGHDTEDCHSLQLRIESLIQGGKLKQYVRDQDRRDDKRTRDDDRPSQDNNDAKEGTSDNKKQNATVVRSLNTISGGFSCGGELGASRRQYVRHVMNTEPLEDVALMPKDFDLSFSDKDWEGIVPHEDDPMVITTRILNFNAKKVLVDPGSSADILFLEAFQGLELDTDLLQPFKGTVVGFLGEPACVRGYVSLKTTFGEGEYSKTIRTRYLVIQCHYSYNIIVGRPSLNSLKGALSTLYLTLKYPLDDVRVGVIKGDQEAARKCYLDSLKLKKPSRVPTSVIPSSVDNVNFVELDPREDYKGEHVEATEEMKLIQIGDTPEKATKIGSTLPLDIENTSLRS